MEYYVISLNYGILCRILEDLRNPTSRMRLDRGIHGSDVSKTVILFHWMVAKSKSPVENGGTHPITGVQPDPPWLRCRGSQWYSGTVPGAAMSGVLLLGTEPMEPVAERSGDFRRRRKRKGMDCGFWGLEILAMGSMVLVH